MAPLNALKKWNASSGQLDRGSPIPVYHQIYQRLKRELMSGDYREGDKFFSYRELKGVYGVELRTIAEAIDLLIAEGFVLKRPASGTYVGDLGKVRRGGVFAGNTWYILFGGETFDHPFYFRLLKGIEREIGKFGLKLVVGVKASRPELLSWFTPARGDGVIITGEIDDPELLGEMAGRVGGQLVTVGAYHDIDAFPNVSVDVVEAVRRALDMALGMGVASLGVVAGPRARHVTNLILETAKAFAAERNLRWGGECLDAEEDGHEALRAFQEKGDLPDCLLVTEPAYIGACHYVAEHGLRCPEHLKIIRYGKEPLNRQYDRFAAINIYSETEAMGALAVETLLAGACGKVLAELKVEVANAR